MCYRCNMLTRGLKDRYLGPICTVFCFFSNQVGRGHFAAITICECNNYTVPQVRGTLWDTIGGAMTVNA